MIRELTSFVRPRALTGKCGVERDQRSRSTLESEGRGRRPQRCDGCPQVMSLLPLDPHLPGLCPGTPRYASASSKAGFARLPETRMPESLRASGPMKTVGFSTTITPVSEKAGRVTG